jgi:hypothetical protein
VGKTAFIAESTSHANAVELTQRQRKTRVIAMDHPNNQPTIDLS